MTENSSWRPVPGFESTYEVSTAGEIRSLDRVVQRRHLSGRCFPLRRRGQILKPVEWAPGCKYLTVTLKDHGRSRTAEVQVIVCETFYGSRPPGMDAAHRDGNPANNRADNLRWATRSENMRDAIKHGTAPRGAQHGMAKLALADVAQIKADRLTSSRDLARRFGVGQTQISRIRSGKRWADQVGAHD